MTVIAGGWRYSWNDDGVDLPPVKYPCCRPRKRRETRTSRVGINLQPNAVRELFDLGFQEQLDHIGIEAKEWALVGRNGNDV